MSSRRWQTVGSPIQGSARDLATNRAGTDVPDRIRVLHLITDLEVGGAELMLTRLLEVGDRSRFNYSVVSLAPGGTLAPRIAEAGIPVVTLGMRRGIPDPFAVGRLLRVVGRQRPDVLQTWLYHADLLGTIASLASSRSSLVWNLR